MMQIKLPIGVPAQCDLLIIRLGGNAPGRSWNDIRRRLVFIQKQRAVPFGIGAQNGDIVRLSLSQTVQHVRTDSRSDIDRVGVHFRRRSMQDLIGVGGIASGPFNQKLRAVTGVVHRFDFGEMRRVVDHAVRRRRHPHHLFEIGEIQPGRNIQIGMPPVVIENPLLGIGGMISVIDK